MTTLSHPLKHPPIAEGFAACRARVVVTLTQLLTDISSDMIINLIRSFWPRIGQDRRDRFDRRPSLRAPPACSRSFLVGL